MTVAVADRLVHTLVVLMVFIPLARLDLSQHSYRWLALCYQIVLPSPPQLRLVTLERVSVSLVLSLLILVGVHSEMTCRRERNIIANMTESNGWFTVHAIQRTRVYVLHSQML
jgi:hypothetical protein